MTSKFLLRTGPLLSLLFAVSQAGAQDTAPAEESAEPAEAGVATAPQAEDSAGSADQAAPVPEVSLKDDFQALMSRPGGLTSDEAGKMAAEYSPDADVAREQYKSAEAQVDKTIYNYAPRVTLMASYTRQSVPEGGAEFGSGNLVATTDPAGPLAPGAPLIGIDGQLLNFTALPNLYYLNAGITIPISDYLLNMSQALSGAKAATKTAQLNEKSSRLIAAANARLAYYEWVGARLRMAETERAIERAKVQLKNLEVLQGGGRVARADVLRQDAFLANVELELRRANTQEAIAREKLHVLMSGGEGATPAWVIGENVLEDRPGDTAETLNTIELHNEAIAQRLEIEALENTAYALEQQASVQRTQGYPRLEGFGNLTYANPNPRYQPPQQAWNASWDVGVRLVWTLNDLGSSYSDAKSSDAEVAKVRAQKRQLSDALRTEILAAKRSIEEAGLARESARRGVMASEAAYLDRKQLFDNGRATSLDVLQAEDALVSSRMNLVDAYIALRMARVRMDHALGRDVATVQPAIGE